MQIFSLRDSNIVIVTKEEGAVSNYQISLEGMAPCNHEEADSCIFVHARHAVAEGYIPLMIKASDTDVLVNAISVFPVLKDLGLENLWLALGQEENLPGFQYMTSVTLLALRSQKDFPSFMHSLVVMFQLFLEKVKRLHGKHGMYILIPQKYSQILVCTHQFLGQKNKRFLKGLLLLCMTGLVGQQMLIVSGLTCLPQAEVIGCNSSNQCRFGSTHKTCCIPSRLHMGPNYNTEDCKPIQLVVPLGGGSNKITCGRLSSTNCRELSAANKVWLQDFMWQ